jgi:hypothetical protein
VTEAEIKALKKELEAAKIEIEMLNLRLANVTLLLKKEMTASGKLPKVNELSN